MMTNCMFWIYNLVESQCSVTAVVDNICLRCVVSFVHIFELYWYLIFKQPFCFQRILLENPTEICDLIFSV